MLLVQVEEGHNLSGIYIFWLKFKFKLNLGDLIFILWFKQALKCLNFLRRVQIFTSFTDTTKTKLLCRSSLKSSVVVKLQE
jgi:hypothetical protein